MKLKKFLCSLLAAMMLALAMPAGLLASPPRQVPYDHVLPRIISRNPDVTGLDRELRYANNRVRSATTALRNLRSTSALDTQTSAAYIHLLQVTLERDLLQSERDQIAVSAEMQLRGHLVNIARYEADLAILEYTLRLQNDMLHHVQQLHRHGFAVTLDVQEAEQAVELSQLHIEMLELFLESERQQLNRLTNHPLNADIRITYTIDTSSPLPDGAVMEQFVADTVGRFPSVIIWCTEERLRNHAFQVQMNNARNRYGGHSMSPETGIINSRMRREHQSSVLERDAAIRHAEQAVHGALAHWEQLKEQQLALEIALAQAIREYDEIQARLHAGFVTQIQVDALATNVAIQEILLAVHRYEFWIGQLILQHPYI